MRPPRRLLEKKYLYSILFMIKVLLLPFFLVIRLSVGAQPGTEIYLFDLEVKRNQVSISNGVNITSRTGYDNQPSFHPERPLVYYVSADSAGETDIMVYDYQTRKTTPLTSTAEREYSPAVTPDKNYISCVIQRSDGAQDIGRYPVSGGTAEVLVDTLICGYYAWYGDEELAVFVLPAPFTLHMINVKTGYDTIVSDSIGRSLHKVPGERAITFIQKTKNGAVIQRWDPEQHIASTVWEALPGRDYDMALMPDGKILMSDGKKLFYYQKRKRSEWNEVPVHGSFPAGNISRLAVNSAGDKIAIVISE
jgi:hypothetical protein